MTSLEVSKSHFVNQRIEETADLIYTLRIVAYIVTLCHGVQLFFLVRSYSHIMNQVILHEAIFTGIMIILTIAILIWTRTYISSIVTWHDLYQQEPPQKFTETLFTISMFAWAGNLFNLCLCYIHGHAILSAVTGLTSDQRAWVRHTDDSFEFIKDHYVNVFLVLTFVSLISFVYFAFAAVVTYRGLTYVNRGISTFLGFSNVCFLITSAFILYGIPQLKTFRDDKLIASNVPRWVFSSLTSVLPILIAISGLVAFSNYRKSRTGFLFSAIIMAAAVFYLVNETGFVLRYGRHTREAFSAEDECFYRMDALDEDYLAAHSCGNKYELDENDYYITDCSGAQNVTVWEHPDREGQNVDYACLNEGCCDIVGNIYAAGIYYLGYLSFFAMFTGVFIAIGSFFLWWVNWMDSNVKPKSVDTNWLITWVVLFVVVIATYFLRNLSPKFFNNIFGGPGFPPETPSTTDQPSAQVVYYL